MYNWNKEREADCVKYFNGIIAGFDASHKTLVSQTAEWWSRHLGEYSAKKDKNAPFKGSADLQTKIIQYSDSAIEARFRAGLNSVQFAKVTAESSQEAIEAAKSVEDYINNYWKDQTGAMEMLPQWFQLVIVEGTSFIKIIADTIKKTVKRYSIVDQIKTVVKKMVGYKVDGISIATETKEVVKHIGARWEIVSLNDLYFWNDDRAFRDVIIHKVYKTRAEIKQMRGEWKNVNELLDKYKTEQSNPGSSPYVVNETSDAKDDYAGTEQGAVSRIPLYEVWGVYEEKDGITEDGHFIISAEHNMYMFGEENPLFDKRKPYEYAQCYNIAQKVIGQGLPQRLAAVNDAADILLDQAVDNNSLANTLNFLYVPSKSFDFSKLQFQNGKGIPVSSLDGSFKELRFSSSVGEITALYGIMQGIGERLSLVADYSLGRESQTNKKATASGTAMLLQQFAVTLDPLLKNIQECMRRSMYQTLQCLYEYMPSEGITYTVGSEQKTLKRQHLEYLDEFRIDMLAGAIDAMVNREEAVAQALLQTFAGDQSGEVDTYKIKENFVKTLSPTLAKEIMRTPQEVQMLQAIQMKAQELAQMEQVLAAKIKEAEDMKGKMIIDRGIEEEEKITAQLDAAGVQGKDREKALKEFRKGYLRMMEGDGGR